MLPSEFIRNIKAELGDAEGAALCESLETTPPVSVRLNPRKLGCREPFADTRPVPWSLHGRYLDRRPAFTLDAAFHAGAYYVQEASSQFVGHLLGESAEGRRILDMCAAPGGKTTLYSTLAGDDGLVVANEIDRRRAQTLADNVRKWGLGNVAVTCNEPSRLAEFEQWFDIVAVDAPCSGEGMFRKDPASREEWSEGNVRLCAARQDEILDAAWRALKPGGILIYSTCTFNRTEDEGSVERLLDRFGEEVVEADTAECEAEWGIVEGRVGPVRTYRFLPHRTVGEGFFAAAARKAPDAGGRTRTPKSRRSLFANPDRAAAAELARWVNEPEKMRFALVGDTFYGYRAAQYDAVRTLSESLAVIYSGVAMGQIFKGRLRPEHSLALYAGLRRDALPSAELAGEELLQYLRKAEVRPEPFAEGINLVTAGPLPVGFVKRIGNRVNNMYPNSMRIMNK
ncbi:MAG: rRNA cytosine-C5-methylase [Alistipes sp.]|nr:rRNA cytosine-C5-methylase [Alistipes sp.]